MGPAGDKSVEGRLMGFAINRQDVGERRPGVCRNDGQHHLGIRCDVYERHLDTMSLGASRDIRGRYLGVRRDVDERQLDTASLGARRDVGGRRLSTASLGAHREVRRLGSWGALPWCPSGSR